MTSTDRRSCREHLLYSRSRVRPEGKEAGIAGGQSEVVSDERGRRSAMGQWRIHRRVPRSVGHRQTVGE